MPRTVPGGAGAALLLSAACAAPAPLSLDVPLAPDDRAALIAVREAAGLHVYAFDPAAPPALPAAIADRGEPVELVALAYASSLGELGFEGAPGDVPLATAGSPARALSPWRRAFARTVAVDDDGAWAPLAALPAGLDGAAVARRATCPELRQVVSPLPDLVDLRAAMVEDDAHALLVLSDETGADRWLRVSVDAVAPVDVGVPGLRSGVAARADDGELWLAGLRVSATSTTPELWHRPAGAAAFVPVPPSPGMATSPNGEIGWLAAWPGGTVWTMNKSGVVERWHEGAWDRREVLDGAVVGSSHGALVARGPDAVDALVAFRYGALDERRVVRLDGAARRVVRSASPRPSALLWLAPLDLTVVGATEGTVVVLADERLEERHQVSAAFDVQAMAPVRFGGLDGALYSGVNGFLREYYPSDGLVCSQPQVGFNVTEVLRVGASWLAAGTRHAMGDPPRRAPAATWLSR